ncbi:MULTISPECIES: hypothetical protein [Shouchella]|uniref:Uncharacterized protein n=1 Tax=Shouchella rhizosphaerae TaxID=866786 RepID=A0ABZ2CNF6_9BACI|nr:hypothetical protein [Shouchella clausii]MCM3314501.1 hypothetical protein [Psychrobacillus sp. MER TA 17]MBU8598633.1 hypothetical protein [Shouchella clausii]MCM3549578.1 hypothetical protein [Shouchella clausii]MCR1287382.1 hypothetical protein [Shouchella clausii]MCY1102845.1 hypothetical protein [Shouchella clausii]
MEKRANDVGVEWGSQSGRHLYEKGDCINFLPPSISFAFHFAKQSYVVA